MYPARTVVISGSTGLIGSALVSALVEQGYDVVRLVRSSRTPPVPLVTDSLWDPTSGTIDQSVIDDAYAVINLAGASIAGKRWDRIVRKELRSSRISATKTLVRAINTSPRPPKVLLSGSATGFYGFPDRIVDESTPAGTTFLAGLCVDWERAAASAMVSGTRVAYLRTGLVMTAQGGTLGKMLPLVKLGIGGPLGSGDQLWSWISLEDEVRAILFLLEHDKAWGPVNLTAPDAVSNSVFMSTLAQAFGKGARVKVPAVALRAAMGQMSSEVVQGVHVKPTVLEALGFKFNHSTLEALAEHIASEAR
jgi:uncharacterized protein (TIGR01777 family)